MSLGRGSWSEEASRETGLLSWTLKTSRSLDQMVKGPNCVPGRRHRVFKDRSMKPFVQRVSSSMWLGRGEVSRVSQEGGWTLSGAPGKVITGRVGGRLASWERVL